FFLSFCLSLFRISSPSFPSWRKPPPTLSPSQCVCVGVSGGVFNVCVCVGVLGGVFNVCVLVFQVVCSMCVCSMCFRWCVQSVCVLVLQDLWDSMCACVCLVCI